MEHKLTLNVLPATFAVCRLAADVPLPTWAAIAGSVPFLSVTRTADELSIVCPDSAVPADEDVKAEKGWSCLKLAGPIDFSMTGVISGLTMVLAAIGITVFVVSTYDTDYILVRHESLERAIRALRMEGHTIHTPDQ